MALTELHHPLPIQHSPPPLLEFFHTPLSARPPLSLLACTRVRGSGHLKINFIRLLESRWPDWGWFVWAPSPIYCCNIWPVFPTVLPRLLLIVAGLIYFSFIILPEYTASIRFYAMPELDWERSNLCWELFLFLFNISVPHSFEYFNLVRF